MMDLIVFSMKAVRLNVMLREKNLLRGVPPLDHVGRIDVTMSCEMHKLIRIRE